MRIKSLSVSGFRAWAQTEQFDLDADAIILIAPNGQGKTSLFDAIMWSLTGSVPRIGSEENVLSKYNETGQASVRVDLQDGDLAYKVSRIYDGGAQGAHVTIGDRSVSGPTADSQLLEVLWPSALSAPDPSDAFVSLFARCVYLQQDLVRDFIQDADDQSRYNALSEIVGTGRVTELQTHLERAKTAWTKATNARFAESGDLRRRLEYLDDQLKSLGAVTISLEGVESRWQSWWKDAAQFLEEKRSVNIGSSRAASSLDRALKALQAKQLAVGREADVLTELLRFVNSRPEKLEGPSEAEARNELEEISNEIAQVQGAIDERAAVKRKAKKQGKTRSKSDELAELATVALHQLGSKCPVCQQSYDKTKTKAYLESLTRTPELALEVIPEEDGLSEMFQRLEDLELRRSTASAALRRATANAEEERIFESELSRRLQTAKISTRSSVEKEIKNRLPDLQRESTAVAGLLEQGEVIAVQLASASEAQRRDEVANELKVVREQVTSAESDHEIRVKTGELAGKILEALRGAAFDLVAEQLAEVEPLFQQIYEMIDPHPAFKAVRLVSNLYRGKGRLQTEVSDPEFEDAHTTSPASIFSSSQLNVLAVSMFLAINLSMRNLPLSCAILDDPLQSLDDLNLLGLVDVLRQVKDRRQLFISTHDARFGALLKRKLRPVEDGERTRVIEITDWTRQGPVVHQYDALRDAVTPAQRLLAR
jgi:exonuclease SbcC